MLQDAIRIIAAALCCEPKKTTLRVTPARELICVSDLVLLLTGEAEIASTGEVRLKTPVILPRKLTFKFRLLPKELFYLFAGVAAKLDVVMFTCEILEGIGDDELNALSEAADCLYIKRFPDRIAVSPCVMEDGFNADKDFPPAFAAGMLLGAALTRHETTFTLGKYARTNAVRWALQALEEFGDPPEKAGKGKVKVPSLRSRFDLKTGKRIRHRNKPCS